MRIDGKAVMLLIAIALVAGAGGYWLGTGGPAEAPTAAAPKPAEPSTAQQAEMSTPQVAATQPPTGGMPAAHPPITSASPHPGSADALPAESGRAHLAQPADPNAKYTHFRVGQRNVKRIIADGDYMWVATSGGAIRYNTKTDDYELFDLRSGLLANGIFHIGKLDDRIVLGTYGGGMAVRDQNDDQWTVYNIPQGLADAFVYDVLKADNGDVWIATWSGANRVRGGDLDDAASWEVFTVANTNNGLPNDWVYALARGKNGEVWLATEGGLARFHNGEWANWGHPDGLGAPYEMVKGQIQFKNDPAEFSKHHARQKSEMGLQEVNVSYNPNYIVALDVAPDGVVWCGTWGGGLARFDGSTWKNYTVNDGLPGNHVFAVQANPDGTLWVGTNNGLARLDGEQFKVFTTADGLFSNIVFALATGPDGSTWVGSFGGVARVASLR